MAIITPPSSNLPPESMQWGRNVDQNFINIENTANENFVNINNQLQQLKSTIDLLSAKIPVTQFVDAPGFYYYSSSTSEPGGGGSSYDPRLLWSLPFGKKVGSPGEAAEDGMLVELLKPGKIILDTYANTGFGITFSTSTDGWSIISTEYSINNGPWIQVAFQKFSSPEGVSAWAFDASLSISSSDIISLEAGTHYVRTKWTAINRNTGFLSIANPTMTLTTI